MILPLEAEVEFVTGLPKNAKKSNFASHSMHYYTECRKTGQKTLYFPEAISRRSDGTYSEIFRKVRADLIQEASA